MTTTPQTASAFVLAPGAAETINILGDAVHILASSGATGGACFVFIEEVPPGVGPPLHRHARENEFFYVLEGTFRFRVDGKDHDAPAGSFVFAPRGSLHSFANTGAQLGRLLVWTVPPEIEPAFRACSAAGLTPADGSQLADVFAKAGVTLEGPPLLHP